MVAVHGEEDEQERVGLVGDRRSLLADHPRPDLYQETRLVPLMGARLSCKTSTGLARHPPSNINHPPSRVQERESERQQRGVTLVRF